MCRIDDYANTSFAAEMWNRRASEWHKWPDEKPQKHDYYLVFYEYFDDFNRRVMGYWDGTHWIKSESYHAFDCKRVLAWCELPEPWSE